jgi:uncharacterized protein (TIRG00374 family)
MIGWRIAMIMLLDVAARAISARAWWHLFPSQGRHGCFARLWMTYLAGSALNDLTPGAPIGGDPFKAIALKEKFAMAVTAATLLSTKLAQAMARALFVMVGTLAVSWSLNLKSLPVRGLVVGFLLTSAGLAAFSLLQLRGISRPARGFLKYLPMSESFTVRIGQTLERVDAHLSDLYKMRPFDFVLSVGLVFVELCIAVIQVWLMMRWIGLPCSWLASLAIESFTVLLGLLLFAVPSALGVQEGSKLLIFAALGLPLSAGVTLGIVFRLMSTANLAVGLAALVWLKPAEQIADSLETVPSLFPSVADSLDTRSERRKGTPAVNASLQSFRRETDRN